MKPFRCTSAVRQNRLDRMVDGTTSVIVTLRLLSCSRTSAAVAKATVSAKRPRVIGAGLMRALSSALSKNRLLWSFEKDDKGFFCNGARTNNTCLVIVFVHIQGRNVPRRGSCFCIEGKPLRQVEGETKFHKNAVVRN